MRLLALLAALGFAVLLTLWTGSVRAGVYAIAVAFIAWAVVTETLGYRDDERRVLARRQRARDRRDRRRMRLRWPRRPTLRGRPAARPIMRRFRGPRESPVIWVLLLIVAAVLFIGFMGGIPAYFT